MTIILLLSALSLSGIAAWYAIAGLMAIFAALPIPIAIMGGALEVSKLVVASWIYNNWKRIPFLMKTYFTVALIVLMLLTSMGIFGFLSKAHLDQTMDTGDNQLQIELIDGKIEREEKRIKDAQTVLDQLDNTVQVLINYDRVRGKNGAIAVREEQKEEREELASIIDSANDTIAEYKTEKLILSKEQLALEAEVGPVKYIAALIYGEEESKTMLEEAVRIVILMIVFVFDPLAVLMVMAASREIAGKRKVTEEVTKREPKEEPKKPYDYFQPSLKEAEDKNEYKLNINDGVSVSEDVVTDKSETQEEENPDEETEKQNRKVGRLLTEIQETKSDKTNSFLKRVGGIKDSPISEGEDPFDK